mmetsp:Transcript_75313/g.213296  ORF Transcript_75313/g.213296 Transcript_75313/m.213296 type:complete len:298 (+) Transcript_75313:1047-1940(+)
MGSLNLSRSAATVFLAMVSLIIDMAASSLPASAPRELSRVSMYRFLSIGWQTSTRTASSSASVSSSTPAKSAAGAAPPAAPSSSRSRYFPYSRLAASWSAGRVRAATSWVASLLWNCESRRVPARAKAIILSIVCSDSVSPCLRTWMHAWSYILRSAERSAPATTASAAGGVSPTSTLLAPSWSPAAVAACASSRSSRIVCTAASASFWSTGAATASKIFEEAMSLSWRTPCAQSSVDLPSAGSVPLLKMLVAIWRYVSTFIFAASLPSRPKAAEAPARASAVLASTLSTTAARFWR